MLLPTPPMFPRKRKPKVKASRIGFGPPTLVSASFDADGPTLTMTFDRPVMLVEFEGTQIIVEDSVTTLSRYTATGAATVLGPTELGVELVYVDPFGDPLGVFLNATGDSGIVAAGDGAAWTGVSGRELPFP